MIYLAFVPIGFFFIGAVVGATQKKRRESYRIKFIDTDQIERFLLEKNIKIGKNAYCSVCGTLITRDKIGMLTDKAGKIFYICNKSHCMTFNRISG